jgi:hypothetical protein
MTTKTAKQLFNEMMKIDREVGVLELQISNAIDYRSRAVADRARRMIATRWAKRAALAAEWNEMQSH